MKITINDGVFGTSIDVHKLFESMANSAREDSAIGQVTERTRKISKFLSEKNSCEYIPDRISEVCVPKRYLPVKDMVATLFGKELVMFMDLRPDLGGVGGLVMRDRPNDIFICKGKVRPVLPVVGHELLHTVKIEQPELYERISKLVRAGIDGAAIRTYAHSKEYVDAVVKQVNKWGGRRILEEMTADVVGDYFAAPSFWQRVSESGFGNASTKKGAALCAHMEKMAAELPDNPLNSDRFHQKSELMERIVAINMGMNIIHNVDNSMSVVKDASPETSETTKRGPVSRGPR